MPFFKNSDAILSKDLVEIGLKFINISGAIDCRKLMPMKCINYKNGVYLENKNRHFQKNMALPIFEGIMQVTDLEKLSWITQCFQI